LLDQGAIPAAALEPSAPSTISARILVAEDDAENNRFLVEVLSAEGHSVAVARDGDSALAQAASDEFDLVLLDLGLPRLSGFEVLERLQRDGWHTPVVVVTGRRGVADAVRCIEQGADDFLTKPIHIELLRARVNSSIEKMRLREREFGQFFPPKLARQFAHRPKLINELPSKHAEVSVLFCDLRNFTLISERVGPETTTRWLRAVMNELTECVVGSEGVLVDYAGDELMAMWGAPEEINDHAARACATAVEILRRLPAISARWRASIGGATDLAIGINSGRALVGHVGTQRKTKYGALGDAFNIGSRVLGATRYVGARVLISGATCAALGPHWSGGSIRRLAQVQLKNVAQPLSLSELRPAHNGDEATALFCVFERALAHFENQQFEQAAALVKQLLTDHSSDGPLLSLSARIDAAMTESATDFDPVWQLPSK